MAGEEKSAPAILFGQEQSRKRAGQKKDARPPAPCPDGQFPNPKQPTHPTDSSFETTPRYVKPSQTRPLHNWRSPKLVTTTGTQISGDKTSDQAAEICHHSLAAPEARRVPPPPLSLRRRPPPGPPPLPKSQPRPKSHTSHLHTRSRSGPDGRARLRLSLRLRHPALVSWPLTSPAPPARGRARKKMPALLLCSLTVTSPNPATASIAPGV